MTKSTAVATVDEAQEAAIAQIEAASELIAAQQQEEYDNEVLQTPILKIGQALTREVQEGDAAAGEFINTLSSESVGDKIDFIIAYYNKGRFASDPKSGRAYTAFSSEIPEHWEPLVGAEFVGEPFTEHPESEERFKDSVNKKEREWDKGPMISTTHNFTGFVCLEGENDETEYQPVRLSLKRTDVPAARKILTLLRMQRNKQPWDNVLTLSTTKKEFGKNVAYVISPTDVKLARKSSVEEKLMASQLAVAVAQGRTNTTGAEDADTIVEPKNDGGLDV